MYIFIFFMIIALSQWITNKILNISDDNSVGYSYSKRDSLIIISFLGLGILLQLLKLKGNLFLYSCIIYATIILTTMIILATIKKIIIEKQREELQQVFDVLEPVLPKNTELDMNNPPFKLGYEKNKINRITININPNTFKETIATNLCLSLNKYLPNYEWINEFDFAARECAFVGTPLPPNVAKYPGSWLRPAEFIPIGLSGLGEVSWTINSIKDSGRSNYVYEDGKIANTVDTPSAPQSLTVGSPLGLDTIIPTTKGYKTIETISVGDKVFGYGNKPVKVLAVYNIHESNELYKITLDALNIDKDDNIVFYADDVHKCAVIKNDKICSIPTSEIKSKDIIPGLTTDYIVTSIQKVKNQNVRCFMINSDNHLFLFTDTKHKDWHGGDAYTFDAAYIYQTGGGKSIYINQEVEVKDEI